MQNQTPVPYKIPRLVHRKLPPRVASHKLNEVRHENAHSAGRTRKLPTRRGTIYLEAHTLSPSQHSRLPSEVLPFLRTLKFPKSHTTSPPWLR